MTGSHGIGAESDRAEGATGWRKLVVVVVWLAAAVPAVPLAVHLPEYGSLQYEDYYSLIFELGGRGEGFSWSPLRYLELKSNEHTIALPAVVLVVNACVAAGDNRVLAAVTLGLMAGTLVLLCRLLPRSLYRHPPWAAVACAALAMMVFTPLGSHHVVKGFSGVIWWLANLFAVAAISVLARATAADSSRRLWTVALLALLGSLSYSSALFVWPALVVGGILLGARRRHVVVLAALGSAAFVVAVTTANTPAHHPPPVFGDIPALLRYVGLFVGGTVADSPTLALVGGAGATVAALLLLVTACAAGHSIRRALAPWCMLVLFGLGNAAATAVTRVGFGLEQALASRYVALSCFVWIGLAGAGMTLAWQSRRRPLATLATVAAVAGLGLVSFATGRDRLAHFVEIAAHQPLVRLALVHGIEDDAALRYITPFPPAVYRAAPFLREIGHVPFDSQPSVTYGERVADAIAADATPSAVDGRFEGVEPMRDRLFRVAGWVTSGRERVDRILIVDDGNSLCGVAVALPGAASGSDTGRRAPWRGYVLAPPETTLVHALVRLVDDSRCYPIAGRLRVPQPHP